MTCRPVLLFKPKYRLGHPENHVFRYLKNIFCLKVSKKIFYLILKTEEALLQAAFEPDMDPAFCSAVCKAVRDAFADETWASQLMPSLTALHNTSNQDRVRASFQVDVTPEQGVVAFIRSTVSLNSSGEGRLHMNPTPAPPQDDNASSSNGLQVYLIQLVEAFGRIAPHALVATSCTQLTAWNALTPEVRAVR